jgi:hypothetical protein
VLIVVKYAEDCVNMFTKVGGIFALGLEPMTLS